ncbi:MAG: hypothetical protein WAO19_10405 [Candidatus Kryptoniota bacterium]
MSNSRLFSVNLKDIGKAVLMALLTALIGTLYHAIKHGAFPALVQLSTIAFAGLGAALAYLVMSFFTNSQNKLFRLEPKAIA